MSWDFDSLWQKTKVFMARAHEADRTGPLFPFWATLALELLARSCLSKVHPSLLADPQGDAGVNILFACGYPASDKIAKSIGAKTVFLRCQTIVPDFTIAEFKFCLALIDRRNRELHTGETAFEQFGTSLWLPEYYKVTEILLSFLEADLWDLLDEDAEAATAMISSIKSKSKKQALDAILKSKKEFEALPLEMQAKLVADGTKKAVDDVDLSAKSIKCPSCPAQAKISGKTIKVGEPRLDENLILQNHLILPTKLQCFSCGLVLDSHAVMYGADLGEEYTVVEQHDPIEFHEIDLANYFEPDYGND